MLVLTDIWRELNPRAQSFTWHDKALKSQSRLDFSLITADLVYLTKESNIMHTPFSDHSAIMLNIQSFDQRNKSGPGFWKLNASLLKDKEYREVKHGVYGKRQTAKMKPLPSVFNSLYSRIKIFVFALNSKRHLSIFV